MHSPDRLSIVIPQRPWFLVLLASLCAGAQQPAAPSPAQPQAATILFHGNILTGTHLRPEDRSPVPARASALAIAADGSILAVGSDKEVLRLRSSGTTLLDLHGAFAMPGFNDAHVHLLSAGTQKALSVDLDGVPTLAAMQERIRRYAASAPPGSWIQGAGWDHTRWPGKELPGRQEIDAVTKGHPALFYRTDGHILVANSAALAAAHITSATPDPPGGRIDRDADGVPTGILRETPATSLVDRIVPPLAWEQRRKALLAAIDDALAHGVTSVQDYSPEWDNFLLFEELEHTGKLPLRIAEWMDFNLPLPVLEERRRSHPSADPLLHLTQLKGFMDGSLGSRTAALAAPYSDDPGNQGLPRYEQEKLNEMSAARAADGFQLGFHAIGDEANTMALNAFSAAEQVARPADEMPPATNPDASIVTAKASKETAPGDLRLRIEHAQILLPGDFDRFARLGVIASMQPSHLLTDMNWAAARLGPERSKYAYAWRSMLDHHVTLAFGTDYPVESIDPMRGLYAAVTRQNEAGTMTFHPEQRISLNEALYAYTQASAFAEFREHRKGRLEPGYLADVVVLDHDLTAIPPRQILATRVLRTLVNGRTVYTAPAKPDATPHRPQPDQD